MLTTGDNDVFSVSKITETDFKHAYHKNQWLDEVADTLASLTESS